MKSTYEKVAEFTQKDQLAFLQDEFYFHSTASMNEAAETVAEFIRDCSSNFCSDIAKKLLETKRCSEKQAWCLAYEFFKIKHLYEAWVEETTKDINE